MSYVLPGPLCAFRGRSWSSSSSSYRAGDSRVPVSSPPESPGSVCLLYCLPSRAWLPPTDFFLGFLCTVSVGEDMVTPSDPLRPHSVPFFSQELLGDAAVMAAAASAAAAAAAPTGHAVATEVSGCQAILADPPPAPGGLGGTGLGSRLAAAKTGREHTARGPEPAAGTRVVSEEGPESLLSPQGEHRCVSDTRGR